MTEFAELLMSMDLSQYNYTVCAFWQCYVGFRTGLRGDQFLIMLRDFMAK
jgi:hypothetical protein